MTTFNVSDLDIFFISYDEPLADKNVEHARKFHEKIDRVHGVKGFHRAHAECARRSTTKRFVTVDGDNLVRSNLFQYECDDLGMEDVVFSFKARNSVNGLEYGNGGVKIWNRDLVLSVPTHEEAGDDNTDFCWTYRYLQIDEIMSDVNCAGSPLQAFRSGYRESVKMSLPGGKKYGSWKEAKEHFYPPNLSRLMVWASVGADSTNGDWCIFGCRLGLHDMWLAKRDVLALIKDYDAMAGRFAEVANCNPGYEARALMGELNLRLGFGIADLSPEQSAWFKRVYINPKRAGLMMPDMEPPKYESR